MISRSLPVKYVRERFLRHLAFLIDAPRPQLIRAAAVVGAFGFLGLIFNTQYGVFLDLSETRCLPERVYLGYPRTGILKRGEIVTFRSNKHLMLDLMTGERIAKLIAGIPGDRIVSNAHGAFVNGVKVGERHPMALKKINAMGKTTVDIDRVLAPGELFVVGTLPRSFDSRYWGILPESTVDRLVMALI